MALIMEWFRASATVGPTPTTNVTGHKQRDSLRWSVENSLTWSLRVVSERWGRDNNEIRKSRTTREMMQN